MRYLYAALVAASVLLPGTASAQQGWPPVNTNPVVAKDPLGITLSVLDWGATCDGTTDDTTAIKAALAAAAGRRLTGAGRVCAVSGQIDLPDNLDLADIEFKQLAPAAGTRTLVKQSGSGPLRLTRVKVDRGAPVANALLSAEGMGIAIANINDVTLDGVEIYNGGAGWGIRVTYGNNILVRDLHVHDMTWSSSNVGDATVGGGEKIIGASFGASNNITLINPRIEHLLGTVPGAGFTNRAMQSDGLNFTEVNNATVFGGYVADVTEGVDTYGNGFETNLWFIGTTFENIGWDGPVGSGGFAVKIGSLRDSGTIGVTVNNVLGRGACFVTSSSASVAPKWTERIRFIDSTCYNPNGQGFTIGLSSVVPYVPPPTDVQCINCVAISDNGLMEFGFKNDEAAGPWTLINPKALGYTTAFIHDVATDKDYSRGIPVETTFLTVANGSPAVITTANLNPNAVVMLDWTGGPITAATIQLPSCTLAMRGNEVEIMSRESIQVVTMTASAGSFSPNLKFSMGSNDSMKWKCRNGVWFQIKPAAQDLAKITTANFSKTSDTTFAAVPGLAVTLLAGKSYACQGYLRTSTGAGGGIKVSLNSPDGLTINTMSVYAANYNAAVTNQRTPMTALGGTMGQATAVTTSVEFLGGIRVATGGTLEVHAAQNTADATATSVLPNSTFSCRQTNL